MADGMEEMTEGLEEISTNLTQISGEIDGADMGGGDLSELSAGLEELGEGISGISQYMTMTGDVEGAAAQLAEVQAGLQEMTTQVTAAFRITGFRARPAGEFHRPTAADRPGWARWLERRRGNPALGDPALADPSHAGPPAAT